MPSTGQSMPAAYAQAPLQQQTLSPLPQPQQPQAPRQATDWDVFWDDRFSRDTPPFTDRRVVHVTATIKPGAQAPDGSTFWEWSSEVYGELTGPALPCLGCVGVPDGRLIVSGMLNRPSGGIPLPPLLDLQGPLIALPRQPRPLPPPPPPPPPVIDVTQIDPRFLMVVQTAGTYQGLNLRTRPTMTAEILGVVPNGAVVISGVAVYSPNGQLVMTQRDILDEADPNGVTAVRWSYVQDVATGRTGLVKGVNADQTRNLKPYVTA